MPVALDKNITAFQNDWRFCNYCHRLWWAGISAENTCSTAPNKQHDGYESWNFYLPANPVQVLQRID